MLPFLVLVLAVHSHQPVCSMRNPATADSLGPGLAIPLALVLQRSWSISPSLPLV
jgi:hypothetical protein